MMVARRSSLAVVLGLILIVIALHSTSDANESELESKDMKFFIHLPHAKIDDSAEKLHHIRNVLRRLKRRVSGLKEQLLRDQPSEKSHDDTAPKITVIVSRPGAPDTKITAGGPKKRLPEVEGDKKLSKALEHIFKGFKSDLRKAKPKSFWLPREPKDLAAAIEKAVGKRAAAAGGSSVAKGGSSSGSSSSSKADKKKKCVGPLCGPLNLMVPEGSNSKRYFLSQNRLELRWNGGGPSSNVTIQLWKYHSFESRELIQTLLKSGKNEGKFIWKVDDKIKPSSRYRIRVETTSNSSDKKLKPKREVVWTDWLTIEPFTRYGARGRKRLWEAGGGPDDH